MVTPNNKQGSAVTAESAERATFSTCRVAFHSTFDTVPDAPSMGTAEWFRGQDLIDKHLSRKCAGCLGSGYQWAENRDNWWWTPCQLCKTARWQAYMQEYAVSCVRGGLMMQNTLFTIRKPTHREIRHFLCRSGVEKNPGPISDRPVINDRPPYGNHPWPNTPIRPVWSPNVCTLFKERLVGVETNPGPGLIVRPNQVLATHTAASTTTVVISTPLTFSSPAALTACANSLGFTMTGGTVMVADDSVGLVYLRNVGLANLVPSPAVKIPDGYAPLGYFRSSGAAAFTGYSMVPTTAPFPYFPKLTDPVELVSTLQTTSATNVSLNAGTGPLVMLGVNSTTSVSNFPASQKIQGNVAVVYGGLLDTQTVPGSGGVTLSDKQLPAQPLVGVEPNPGPVTELSANAKIFVPRGETVSMALLGGGSHKTKALLAEAIAHDEDRLGEPVPFNANHEDEDATPVAAMSSASNAAWYTVKKRVYKKHKHRIPRVSPDGQLLYSIGLLLEEEGERAVEAGEETPSGVPREEKQPTRPARPAGDPNESAAREKKEKERAARSVAKKTQRRLWHVAQVEQAVAATCDNRTAILALETLIAHRAREAEYQQLYMKAQSAQCDKWACQIAYAMSNGQTFDWLFHQLAPMASDHELILFAAGIVDAMKPNEGGWIPDLSVFGCVEKNPGPYFPTSQEEAISKGKKLEDVATTVPAGEIVNARSLFAETVFLQTGLNPNLTDVNSLLPFSVSTVDNVGTRVTRTFFPREILFVPDAVNIAGVLTARAISSRWVVFAELQVSGRPLLPSEAAAEMVQAAVKGMKNLMRNDNIIIRGFRTNDVISVAQAKSVRGITLTQWFLKLLLQYAGQSWADQMQNIPEIGQMSNYRNTNTTDPAVAVTIDANVSDAAVGVGEALGGLTAVLPFNQGAGQLTFVTGLDAVPAGQTAWCCPPGFINMFTNGAVGSSVGIAALVMCIATYPGFLLHNRRSVLDAGINTTLIRAVPNSSTVYVPGQSQIFVLLPRSGPVPTPVNQATANAAAQLQPTAGSTATTAFPGPGNAINVSWPGNLTTVSLAEYLLSWSTDINRSVIRKVMSAFFALGDFDSDTWAAWELACTCVARYPSMVQTLPTMVPVAWARGAAANTANEIRHTLFTGFHTQSVGLPLTTAARPPAEVFISGVETLAWNKVAMGVGFKDTEEYVVKELPYFLSESIPLALMMVQTRLYAAAIQTAAMTHRVPESSMTTQVFSNAQFMAFRDVCEEFICPGDGTNLTAKGATGGELVERALTLIHGNRVAREASGLHLFNRWTSPKELFGNVLDSAALVARQGYAWGVLPDIWYNLIVNVAPFALTTPINPYMPDGSRPVREGHRNIKPAFTAAKWGPLARVSEKYAYLDQGELLELKDEEIWNVRLMDLDTVLATDNETIQEVVFTDRLPAGNLPGDRQRTAVEFGLTPSHALCSIKGVWYDNVAGVPLIPTTTAATANSVVSGITPPNVLALIMMHVPGQSSYIGPKKESYMMRILKGLKGGPPSSAETKQGSSATDSTITTSGKN